MPERNRTIDDSGIRLSGSLIDFPAITGTGVTPAQAADLAAPIVQFLGMLPYYLDSTGQLAYKSNTTTLNHEPELRYGPDHPQAGELIWAKWNDADFALRFGNAPMPFIDMDMIPPHSLAQLLRVLTDIRDNVLNAT